MSKSGLICGVVLILNMKYSKCFTISNTFFHTFLTKFLLLCSSLLKYLVKWQTVQTLIRLLLKEQSDLGLHYLHKHMKYSKCFTISNTFFHTFLTKFLLLCSSLLKYLVKWQTVQTLIRLLLKEQSDLGLHCLHKPRNLGKYKGLTKAGCNSGVVLISSGSNSVMVLILSGCNSGVVLISSGLNNGVVLILSGRNSGVVLILNGCNSGVVLILSGHKV